jgi:hypothetical protein
MAMFMVVIAEFLVCPPLVFFLKLCIPDKEVVFFFFLKYFFKNNFPLRINYRQIVLLKGDEEMVIRRSTTESMN